MLADGGEAETGVFQLLRLWWSSLTVSMMVGGGASSQTMEERNECCLSIVVVVSPEAVPELTVGESALPRWDSGLFEAPPGPKTPQGSYHWFVESGLRNALPRLATSAIGLSGVPQTWHVNAISGLVVLSRRSPGGEGRPTTGDDARVDHHRHIGEQFGTWPPSNAWPAGE